MSRSGCRSTRGCIGAPPPPLSATESGGRPTGAAGEPGNSVWRPELPSEGVGVVLGNSLAFDKFPGDSLDVSAIVLGFLKPLSLKLSRKLAAAFGSWGPLRGGGPPKALPASSPGPFSWFGVRSAAGSESWELGVVPKGRCSAGLPARLSDKLLGVSGNLAAFEPG